MRFLQPAARKAKFFPPYVCESRGGTCPKGTGPAASLVSTSESLPILAILAASVTQFLRIPGPRLGGSMTHAL